MNNENLPDFKSILHEETLKHDLVQTVNSLNNWIKYRDDHIELMNHLQSITEDLSYKMMVPITSKALMKGFMVHTNELLVNLGDNWFVKRSATQTRDICNRRIQKATEMIELYQKQFKLIDDRLKYSNIDESKNFVDIVEPYDEEIEKKWREQHKINVRKEKCEN